MTTQRPSWRLIPRRLWATEAVLDIELNLPEQSEERPPQVRLVGPACFGRRTVTSVYEATLADQTSNLVRYQLVVTEPCYWTPETPYTYRLQFAGAATRTQATVGLRHLTVRGRKLWLTGRRWEPRACHVEAGLRSDQAVSAIVNKGYRLAVASVDRSAAATASEVGLALFVVVADKQTAERTVSELSNEAAVLAWVASSEAVAQLLRRVDPMRPIGCLTNAEIPGSDFQVAVGAASADGFAVPVVHAEPVPG